MQLFPQVSDQLASLSTGRSVLAPPGSITTCLAACPRAWHGASSNTSLRQLICQSAASAGSGDTAPDIPTFHGFSMPATMSLQEPRHAGQEQPGCAPLALLSAGSLLPPPFFGGSLSTLQIKGCQIPRCWKPSSAFPHVMLMGYRRLRPTLSPPLPLISAGSPQDRSHTVRSEKMFYFSEHPSKEGQTCKAVQDLVLPC